MVRKTLKYTFTLFLYFELTKKYSYKFYWSE